MSDKPTQIINHISDYTGCLMILNTARHIKESINDQMGSVTCIIILVNAIRLPINAVIDNVTNSFIPVVDIRPWRQCWGCE